MSMNSIMNLVNNNSSVSSPPKPRIQDFT